MKYEERRGRTGQLVRRLDEAGEVESSAMDSCSVLKNIYTSSCNCRQSGAHGRVLEREW